MTPPEAFLQAIINDPNDNDVRLIYADWLEEQGDPRGEFIRLQIELARYSSGQRPTLLTQREHELLQLHGREWAGALPGLARRWSFQRGFVNQVVIRSQDFFAIVAQLVRLAPIEHLSLEYDTYSALPPQFASDAASLGSDPPLTHLRSLTLPSNYLNNWDVRSLSAWTFFAQLEELDLSLNMIGDVGVRALAGSTFFPHLRVLNLSQNNITVDGVRALEAALVEQWEQGYGMNLEVLDLRGNRLSSAGRQELQRTRLVKRVALLDRPSTRLSGAQSAHPNP